MEIVYVYTKKRSEFGRQPLFSDSHAQIHINIEPDDSLRENFIAKDPVDMAVQYAPEMTENEANTERYETESRGMNHTEGGWPKDINPAEVEQTIRFRKKVEKDEGYIGVIMRLGTGMEHYLRQNNAIDIYENYFSSSELTQISSEPPSAKTISVFRDPNEAKRAVTHISWYPDGASRLAAAYSILEFQKSSSEISLESYIWELENPNKPEHILRPTSPMLCLEYNPKDPHTLVGGCYNGQLAVFDTRKGPQPVEVTPVEISHNDPVHKLIFPSSKTGSDVFSTSTDGRVMWWDIRKLGEPVETLPLEYAGYRPGQKLGGIALEYESSMPTKFMVGTEQGAILLCNRKGKTQADKITHAFVGHHGPIFSLQRNPFYPKYFLSVGDWTARVWSEDAKESPVMWTRYDNTVLTDSCWSATRPGVFYTTSMSGTLNVWDIVFKQNTPALTVQVCDDSLHSVRCHDHGKLIACGSHSGDITLLEMSDFLSILQPNEKQNITAILERETHREKILEGRRREIKLKLKQQSAGAAGSAGAGGGGGGEGAEEEEDFVGNAEQDFWNLLSQEQKDVQAKEEKRREALMPNQPTPIPEEERLEEEEEEEQGTGEAQEGEEAKKEEGEVQKEEEAKKEVEKEGGEVKTQGEKEVGEAEKKKEGETQEIKKEEEEVKNEGETQEGEVSKEGGEIKKEGETQEGEAKKEGETQEGEAKKEGETQEGEAKKEGETQEGEVKKEEETQEGEVKKEETQEGGEVMKEGETQEGEVKKEETQEGEVKKEETQEEAVKKEETQEGEVVKKGETQEGEVGRGTGSQEAVPAESKKET